MSPDDDKQLRLLSTLHYAGAALACGIPIAGGVYAAFGVAILLGMVPRSTPPTPAALGWVPVIVGTILLIVGAVEVGLNLFTARSLRARRHHTLCLVTSALNCVHFPIGTLLGTFTLIVLCRPAVRAEFESSEGTLAPPPGAAAVGAEPGSVTDARA